MSTALLCSAKDSSGNCVGNTVTIPDPSTDGAAYIVSAIVGGLLGYLGSGFLADRFNFLKFLQNKWIGTGAGIATGFGVGALIDNAEANQTIARQQAAWTCLGQSAWLQGQIENWQPNQTFRPPGVVMAACGFLPSEYAYVTANMVAFQQQGQAQTNAQNSSAENTFVTAAKTIISFF